MNPATNLILVGPMGAGKSSAAPALAAHFGLRPLDLDAELERHAGCTIEAIFTGEGEAGFRARERALLAELLAGDGVLLATGGGTVLDPGNRRLLAARGFVVHLHAGVARQLARLAGDRSRPLLAGPDREPTLRQLAAARAPLYAEVADLTLDTDPLAVDELLPRLTALLGRHWRRGASA